MIRFGSLFSGIEAASVAWSPLGWRCAWVAEVEPFPRAVLAHRYPGLVNLGDVTAPDFPSRAQALGPLEMVCGGPPCQAFSVAGLRQSMQDQRGLLSPRFVEIANALDPRFVFWENVPGVLGTKDNAFGYLLAGLVGEDAPLLAPGGRWTHAGVVAGPRRTLAWRILDAQYFGLAQRRRRVFLLAVRAGEGPHPAEVLFEPESLRRDHPPGRSQGQEVACCLVSGSGGPGRFDPTTEQLITHALFGEGFDASEDGTGRGVPLVVGGGSHPTVSGDHAPSLTTRRGDQTAVVAFQDRFRGDDGRGYDRPPPTTEDIVGSLETVKPWCVAFESRVARNGRGGPSSVVPSLKAQSDQTGKGDAAPLVALTCGDRGITPDQAAAGMIQPHGTQVRRLTPRECEHLQGFPDDYTLIPYRGRPAGECPDGPRYKALGNSWAINPVRWIGERLNRFLIAGKAA